MSYASGAALQAAIYQQLTADPALGALVQGIHDSPPPGTPQGTYVVLGDDEAIDRGDITGPGSEHRLTLTVVSDAPGFLTAKAAAGRIVDLLTGPPLALQTGRIVAVWFQDLRARRLEGGTIRKIDIRLRVRIEGDADAIGG